MTAKKREFQKIVQNLLESMFPESNGWEISIGKDWKGYKIDFVAERREESKRYRSVIKCITKCDITPLHIKHINMAARRMSGRYVKIEKKILAVPANSNFKNIEGFEIIKVNDFDCEDDQAS